jgi:MOSC domain-containing protein YiiM
MADTILSVNGRIAAIHLCRAHREPMESVTRANAVAGKGLAGDRHGREVGKRHVLLAEAEELRKLDLAPGTIRENITVEGIRLAALRPGQRLRLGADVLADVVGPCEPCFRMDEIRPGLQKGLIGRRGVFVQILKGGALAVGDPVTEGTGVAV